jgi:ABC-2 type transport system ATP-binding protein
VTAADIDGDRLRVAASRSEGLLADLVAAAAARGVVVHDATSQPPSLESVFLALTGRDLRE